MSDIDLLERLGNANACIGERYPSALLREAADEIEKLRNQLVKQSWQPASTAPKDGKTFWAMEWLENEEDSCHWALYWEVDRFECVETGKSNRVFTHWMPIAKFTHPDDLREGD